MESLEPIIANIDDEILQEAMKHLKAKTVVPEMMHHGSVNKIKRTNHKDIIRRYFCLT